MSTVYLLEQYSIVKLEGEALRIDIPASELLNRAKSRKRIPLLHVDQVVIFGEVTLTASVIGALLERRVALHFLSPYGRSRGSLIPDPSKNAFLRIAQYQAYNDLAKRFTLACHCIEGKLKNMRSFVQRAQRRNQHPELKKTINELQSVRHALSQISPTETYDPNDRMNGLGQIFGAEGNGSASYWRAFKHILNPPWQWNGRKRRPPPDPVNALLSFGYTILINQAVSQICIVGLDPYIGFLHQPGFGKPALALDLVEEFRTIIVDSTVINLLNNNILKPRDFQEHAGSVRLSDEGRKVFLSKIEERLNTEIEHPIFNYRTTYRRCLELQARLMAKALTGEIPSYPAFTTR